MRLVLEEAEFKQYQIVQTGEEDNEPTYLFQEVNSVKCTIIQQINAAFESKYRHAL